MTSTRFFAPICLVLSLSGLACSSTNEPAPPLCGGGTRVASAPLSGDLRQRAYIVSRDSGNVTVIDLESMRIAGETDVCGLHNHMIELNADYSKAFITSSGTNETIVMDTRSLEILERIKVADDPTHLTLSRDGRWLAVVGEAVNAVSFIDPNTHAEVKRLPGFNTPHMVRYAEDMKTAYVANVGADYISKVDLETFGIVEHIALDGFAAPEPGSTAPEEDHGFDDEHEYEPGFADVQIDRDGVLYAAHNRTGRVLVYDTRAQKKLKELQVGKNPWIVYAEHPFENVKVHTVPTFGDESVSIINGIQRDVIGAVQAGDRESFGVNYSRLAPNRAFVMNRIRNDIAVIDTETQKPVTSIPVGGNTETASTTADGRYIVATVSSANRVVVIDAKTNEIVKTFDNVGNYPWAVSIPLGQNYCH